MLKLIDYRTRAKGLPDLLPYALLAAPGRRSSISG
jgi:hypothetical protein